jgi:hypothetical protein
MTNTVPCCTAASQRSGAGRRAGTCDLIVSSGMVLQGPSKWAEHDRASLTPRKTMTSSERA